MVHSAPSSPASTNPDLPPSYDLATSLPPASEPPNDYASEEVSSSSYAAGPSASSSSSSPEGTIPKHIAHLFAGPPHPEPILSSSLPHIDVEKKKTLNRVDTWDPKLIDPTTLYDFCRQEVLNVPEVKLRCVGAHIIVPERDEVVNLPNNGGMRHRKKGQPERIVDFDFMIDLAELVDHPDNKANIHLSVVPPEAPEYRGSHKLSYAATVAPPRRDHRHASYAQLESSYRETDVGRAISRREAKTWNDWLVFRKGKGAGYWEKMKDWPDFESSRNTGRRSQGDAGVLLGENDDEEEQVGEERQVRGEGQVPHAGLKEWCEAYCRDQGLLKEFYLRKGAWGWELQGLLAAVRGAILSTGYQSNELTVQFLFSDDVVVVHPPNLLSRALGSTFICVLLWITLLYPLLWVWRRLHPLGGGIYDVARGTYCTKFYPPLPATFPAESLAAAKHRLPRMYKEHPEIPKTAAETLQRGPRGVHYLLGRREGEWFREWEERIKMGVRLRYQGVLEGGAPGGEGNGVGLDGY